MLEKAISFYLQQRNQPAAAVVKKIEPEGAKSEGPEKVEQKAPPATDDIKEMSLLQLEFSPQHLPSQPAAAVDKKIEEPQDQSEGAKSEGPEEVEQKASPATVSTDDIKEMSLLQLEFSPQHLPSQLSVEPVNQQAIISKPGVTPEILNLALQNSYNTLQNKNAGPTGALTLAKRSDCHKEDKEEKMAKLLREHGFVEAAEASGPANFKMFLLHCFLGEVYCELNK
ncbi:uncharacterized protein LOC132194776 [Neocloeon triangulifer]|uniref:uncharacterized protein LOC132194776 n=1 Tax=Neocloeon triangulifer TaxID=2078957 RepID=UPI00286F5C59|nr:uncharacterized protein LOC132194776 [Neocloeon triangulifer]